MIFLYGVLTNILYPFLFLFLKLRVFLKKEDPIRYKEKISIKHFNIKRSIDKKLLWFHAASIGEYKSIIPIIKKLNSDNNDYQFLITTTTLSSGNLATLETKKYDNIYHRFLPYDLNHLLEKFLSLWRPDNIFLVDSEIWPNLILKAAKKKISISLLNARLTKKSFLRWSFFPKTAKKIFGTFKLCLCSNKETQYYLEKLGANNIYYFGNLKFIQNLEFSETSNINNELLKKKFFWVAASTHEEEEIFCLKTHLELKKHYNNIITFIAPRHISRTLKIKSLFENYDLKTQVLSSKDEVLEEVEIVIINSFGNLNNYFRNAKSVFLGKSIVERLKDDSGQNPIEAAWLNCKIYHGPYVSNFKEIYEILKKNKISKEIKDYKELAKHLLNDLKSNTIEKNENSNSINILGQNILSNTILQIKNILNDQN